MEKLCGRIRAAGQAPGIREAVTDTTMLIISNDTVNEQSKNARHVAPRLNASG
jgi:hypothetical protein